MASISVKVGSAIVACALAAGVSTAAGAAPNTGFGHANVSSVRGKTMGRAQMKTAAAVTTFTTLYNFLGEGDGANPTGELLEDFQGNLYGTTQIGGTGGQGTVYKYSGGVLTTLHTFSGPDGATPQGGLLNSIGNLNLGGNVYGVTSGGGYRNYGEVYSVNSTTGAFSVIHKFKGGGDGDTPYGHLILFTDGNIYGTAYAGGGYNVGLVFRITPKGVYSVVNCFNNKTGAYPIDGLSASLKGYSINKSLFGTTSAGGAYGAGTVFAISPTTGRITNLHSFNPAVDGSAPVAALIPDDAGNLYGTASAGGSGSAGTIFEISSAGMFSVLYSFPIDPTTGLNPSGFQPLSRLASFLNGKLYGSTAFGGPTGGGVIFEYAAGTFTLLHTFGGTDGSTPDGQLLLSPDGNIYGTASEGGSGSYGTLFALPLAGT